MLKQTKYTYAGINQDLSKSKRDNRFYFDAQNIRIFATDSTSTASATNEKGNELIFALPNGQTILGHAVLGDILVLFSTTNDTYNALTSIDKITTVNLKTYESFELFSGSLGFNVNNFIETEVYLESDTVQKVYWVDGLNQLRHINIVNLVDGVQTKYTQDEAMLFDSVPEVNFCSPEISSISYGGTHTSGMIQYGYNLIKLKGSQSSISPLTELYPIDKVLGGGTVNEVVGKVFNINIPLVDTRYDIIRLYAIKFTSLNTTPSINLIAEEYIGNTSSFNYSDDGRVISTLTSAEFLFLGGIPYIPSTITTKFNRLILGNIKEEYFDIPYSTYDTRAYRFPINSNVSNIFDENDAFSYNITYSNRTVTLVNSTGNTVNIPEKFNCSYNSAYSDTYVYKANSTIYGATGPNIEVSIIQKTLDSAKNVLKSNEKYRIGIEFYNKRGQTSPPKWICDVQIPFGNINGLYNTLKVELFNTSVLENAGVVGYRILRVERTEQDKTIICQGILNGMMFQKYVDISKTPTIAEGISAANDSHKKVPSHIMRTYTNIIEDWKYFNDSVYVSRGIKHGQPISGRSVENHQDPRNEIIQAEDGRQNTFEETRLMTMYSPELIFNDIHTDSSIKWKPVCGVSNTLTNSSAWAHQIDESTLYLHNILESDGHINLYNESIKSSFNGKSEFHQNGLIGGVGDAGNQNRYQYYRKFVYSSTTKNNTAREMLSTPIVVKRGEKNVTYADNTLKYRIDNTLNTIMGDKLTDDSNCEPIISVLSQGNNCMVFADKYEQTLETSIYNSLTSPAYSTLLIDLVRTLYNQYGGHTYESRSKNTYLRIGTYQPITTTSISIDHAGDTFVYPFRFARILPNDSVTVNHKFLVISEIVEFPVETSIDLENRSDASINGWNSLFQPSFDEYHKYNNVYSQQPIFNTTTANPFTFEERKSFTNRLNATKTKTVGELVDSWTDILPNEEKYLDGKYGKITKIIRNNDAVYAFQEKAIALLEIQPRIQTVASDGVSIELGTGSVLYNYRYVTTTSGSTNQRCIFNSSMATYYLDVNNKSINRIVNGAIEGLSDRNGLHSYMYNNISNDMQNSPYVIGEFDQITNDAYFTTELFTLAFNEGSNSFISRYSFKPKTYIYSSNGFISSDNNRSLYLHGYGTVGNFYGVTYDSFVTFLFCPTPDGDNVFTNLEFKSEFYNNKIDLPAIGMTNIHCWNEYQDSGDISLIVGKNLKRIYRNWGLFIPRNAVNVLQRMRGPWLFCKLGFNNTKDYDMILHDIIVTYDEIQKM